MNSVKIVRKIGFLLKKLNNPSFFIYLVFHYIKKDLPLGLSRRIARSNLGDYSIRENEFHIRTYEGSNQAVHPDMCYYGEKYWLVLTPYPYGMEEYENPSIYYADDLNCFIEIKENPIEKQRRHRIGFHLSDPCLFEWRRRLICAYRENVRENDSERTYIFIKKMAKDGNWGDSRLLLENSIDPILSPAFYVVDDSVHMIHVRRIGNDSELIHSVFNDELRWIDSKTTECKGIPESYYIWHIGVSFKNGMKKAGPNDLLQGLFLLRHKELQGEFKLYYSEKKHNNQWECKKEIVPPADIYKAMHHPYKACFVPNTKMIVYSYVDKRNRYRLTMFEVS